MTARHTRLPLLAATLMLTALTAAHAQTTFSGSAGVLSDYRYRGLSLSDGNAAYQLTLNVDHASGWYGGLFATTATVADREGAQLIAYAGYAQRLRNGASWEAGCTRSSYTSWHFGDYNECYAGLAIERSSARLSYAPRYLGYDNRTLYAELNSYYPLHDNINLTGHAGLLRTLSGIAWPGVPERQRYDLRAGISIRLGDWNAQLARSYTQAESRAALGVYGPAGPRYVSSPAAWIFGATYAF